MEKAFKKKISVASGVVLLAVVVFVIGQQLGFDPLSGGNLRGTVTSFPSMPSTPSTVASTATSPALASAAAASSTSSCGNRSFTQCQDLPNVGTLAGCTVTQYCGLGFGLTGFVCKCKGSSSSSSTSSAPAAGYCCQAFSPPAPSLVCIPVGPGRCGAPGPVTSYSTSNCDGNCPAPVSSSS